MIGYVGHGLQRPECILAEPDGTLWTADTRGGAVNIDTNTGDQELIIQGRTAGSKRPPTMPAILPRVRCPTAWPSPPTATS